LRIFTALDFAPGEFRPGKDMSNLSLKVIEAGPEKFRKKLIRSYKIL
jgi:hypothetical protein